MTCLRLADYCFMRQPLILALLSCAGFLSACADQEQYRPVLAEPPLHDSMMETPTITAPVPAMSRTLIGTSVQGRPIEMIRFGVGAPTLLIISGIHGNEPESWFVAEQLIRTLESSPGMVRYGSVVIIPRANPDGCALRRRANARGVDVNRNFPASNWRVSKPGAEYPGPSPASEPETIAVLAAMESCKPDRIISIHSITRGRECNNYDGGGRQLAAMLGRYNGYPVRDSIGYETPGSFGTYAGTDHHLSVVTLELPRDLNRDLAWSSSRQGLLSAIDQRSSELRAGVGNSQ
jgi:murein peptide amidase A